MSKKSKIYVAIAVAEGFLSTDHIIAYGESRSCALAVAGLVEVVKLCVDELNEFRHREVSAAIEADSPEIAAAEARWKVEGIRIAQKVMHAEKFVARDCGEAATVLALQSIHRDLEQCIAALQAEKEST